MISGRYFIFLTLALISVASFAEDRHADNHAQASQEVENLSTELRGLLSKEMLALQDGMMAIIPAYASGDWHQISHIALKMKNSYILKQSLSTSQVHELHSTLHESFLKNDQKFHYLAGMLSHAADVQKPELIGFYYAELMRSCVSCHSQFAQHRFPALAPKPVTGSHH